MLNPGEDGVASWLGCLLLPIYRLLFLSLFLSEDFARRGLLAFRLGSDYLSVIHPPLSFSPAQSSSPDPTSPLIATTTTTNNRSSANFFVSESYQSLKWITQKLALTLIFA